MYKDKEEQRASNRASAKRYRKGMTQRNPKSINRDMTKGEVLDREVTKEGMTHCPDIIDKLTDPIWRGKLGKICNAFQSSHHPSYINDVWMGDFNLSQVCELLECTA